MHPRRRNHPAFTLLELILVMAIVAIIVAMASPMLRGFGEARRGDNCAAELVALTQWARTQAMTRGATYRLNMDPNSRTYWLTVDQGDGITFASPGTEFGRVFVAPDGVTLGWDVVPRQDGQYISFWPNGRTDAATIRVANARGEATQVACLSATETFHVLSEQELAAGYGIH
jgi:prepilin-type N-terminal cleavage/methylation domain-containing protein